MKVIYFLKGDKAMITTLKEMKKRTYMPNKEFKAVFQLSKTVIFEVEYYTLGYNSHPYFATTASQFCRNKRDFSRCGQCQNDILTGKAKRFWKKWDDLHLKDLSEVQYAEMFGDLEDLFERYNFMYEDYDESKKPYSYTGFHFSDLVEFSKQEPKKWR